MKTTSTLQNGKIFRRLAFLLAAIAGATVQQGAEAQTPVTGVFTHMNDAVTATNYSSTGATGNSPSAFVGNTYTYKFGTNVAATNNTEILDSFTAVGMNYHYQASVMTVKFQRVDNATVTGLRKSLTFEQKGGIVPAGGTAKLYADYDDSLERIYSAGQTFNVGIDNVFQNAATTNNNNIEREDVLFPSGVSAIDNTKVGFVLFDRGNAGSHDPFYIAAVKTLDLFGNPSSYYNAVLVSSANYGVA